MERFKVKMNYLRNVAPVEIPGLRDDPRNLMQYMGYMNSVELPTKTEDEDRVLPPSSFGSGLWGGVEHNEEYKAKTFVEQQQYKQIWYHKMAVKDTTFNSLPLATQQSYYDKLMMRAPGNESGLYAPYVPKKIDILNAQDMSKQRVARANFTLNLGKAFGGAYAALAAGPIRFAAGPDSGIGKVFRDVEKMSTWYSYLGEQKGINRFTTGVLPSIVGYGVGIIAPGSLFGNLEKALAGSTKVVSGVVKKVPGLFQRAGTAVGAKLPDLTYQVTGGAVAGVMQGIGEAMVEDKPWHTYIPRDVSIGVAAEFGVRYLGMLRGLRKAAKAAGMSTADMLQGPFKFDGSKVASAELENILQGNPEMAAAYRASKMVDHQGRPLVNMRSPAGVRSLADILGFEADFTNDSLKLNRAAKIIKSKGGYYKVKITPKVPLAQEFFGSEEVRIDKAVAWMDNSKEARGLWDEAVKSQVHPGEAISAAPQVELRVGDFVPEDGRKILLDHFDRSGQDLGISYTADPRGATARSLDRTYAIIRKMSPAKAETTLRGLGVIFDEDIASNKIIIKQIKGELNEALPEHAFYVLNSETHQPVPNDQLPSYFLTHPKLKQPVKFGHTFMGSGRDVRKMISTMRKQYTNAERAITKVSKSAGNMSILNKVDTQMVEVRARVADGTGKLNDTVLSFNSLKQAQDVLSIGTNRGMKATAKHIFDNNPAVRKSYDDFVKVLRKTDPRKLETEWVPYTFAAKMADDQGYALSYYNGKYVVQDLLDDSGNFKQWIFDNVNDTVEWFNHLQRTMAKDVAPDLLRGLKREAVEELGNDNLLKDPMRDIGPEALKRNGRYGLRTLLSVGLQPSQYAMQRLDKLAVVGELRSQGLDMVRYFNDFQLANRSLNSFSNPRISFLNKMAKGVNKPEVKMMSRWLEALDNVDELQAIEKKLKPLYEMKPDIENLMMETFGAARGTELVEKSNTLRRYMDELFALAGEDANKYLKHYIPHLREQIKLHSNLGDTLHPGKLTDIPDADKQFFFELLRETDPGQVAFQDDVFKTVETYTHLMGRKLTIRPTMHKIGNQVRDITAKLNARGALPADYEAVTHYVGEMMRSMEGIDGPTQRIFEMAMSNTMDSLKESLGIKWGPQTRKFDIMSRLSTLTTGAHLAARPITVFRNFTQSLITGGSLIGNDWWAEGMEKALIPGNMRRMMNLGQMKLGEIPTAAGTLVRGADEGVFPRIVHMAMGPYKFADSFNRTVVYLGMESRLDHAIGLFRKGAITKKRFETLSGARLFGKQQFNAGAAILDGAQDFDKGVAAWKDHFANLAVSRSQYLYNAFDQPQWFRSAIGRFFGQYTSWPINYASMLLERMTSDSISIAEKAKFFGRMALNTTAISYGLWSVGMNPRSWAPWNMGTMQGGPYFQLMNDSLKAAGGDQQAYINVVKFMTSIVPFAYEGEGVLRAIQAYQDGEFWEAAMHLASAPPRYDLYPRRETFVDDIEKKLMGAGNIYFGTIAGKGIPEVFGSL